MITWYLYNWLILDKNSANEESIIGGFKKSKVRIKENKVYLIIKLPYGEQVDADQIKALTQRCNHGFFNVSKYTRNKIELFCPIGNSLNQRLNQPTVFTVKIEVKDGKLSFVDINKGNLAPKLESNEEDDLNKGITISSKVDLKADSISNKKGVSTGDNSNISLSCMLMTVSVLGLGLLKYLKRRALS